MSRTGVPSNRSTPENSTSAAPTLLDAHQAQADAVGTGRVAAGEDPGAGAAVGEQERDRPQRAGGVDGVAWVHGPVEEGHEPGPVEAVETIEGGESAGSTSTTPRVTGA